MTTMHPADSLEGYALGALAPDEAASVSAHVQHCLTCQARLRDIDRTLGLLASLAPNLPPPPDAEERLFARIAKLRQQTPSAEHGTFTASPAAGPAARRHRANMLSARRRIASAPWAMRAVYGLAALTALLLLTIGILAGQLRAAQMTNDMLTARLTAQQQALGLVNTPGAVVRHLAATDQAAGGATGTMVMDPKDKSGAFVVSGLPQLPPGKAYEFWLVETRPGSAEGEAIPVGTFHVNSQGEAIFTFNTNLSSDQLSNAGVSIEPEGGTQHPDSPMIMLIVS